MWVFIFKPTFIMCSFICQVNKWGRVCVCVDYLHAHIHWRFGHAHHETTDWLPSLRSQGRGRLMSTFCTSTQIKICTWPDSRELLKWLKHLFTLLWTIYYYDTPTQLDVLLWQTLTCQLTVLFCPELMPLSAISWRFNLCLTVGHCMSINTLYRSIR